MLSPHVPHHRQHTLRRSEDEGPTLLFWVDERPAVGEVPAQDMGTFKAGAHGGLKVQVESGGMMFLRANELWHGSEAGAEAFAIGAVRWGSALFANAKADPSLKRLEERFMEFKAQCCMPALHWRSRGQGRTMVCDILSDPSE